MPLLSFITPFNNFSWICLVIKRNSCCIKCMTKFMKQNRIICFKVWYSTYSISQRSHIMRIYKNGTWFRNTIFHWFRHIYASTFISIFRTTLSNKFIEE